MKGALGKMESVCEVKRMIFLPIKEGLRDLEFQMKMLQSVAFMMDSKLLSVERLMEESIGKRVTEVRRKEGRRVVTSKGVQSEVQARGSRTHLWKEDESTHPKSFGGLSAQTIDKKVKDPHK